MLLNLSLHISHRLLHDLQHLCFQHQYLLKSWWWRRVGSIVDIVLINVAVYDEFSDKSVHSDEWVQIANELKPIYPSVTPFR
jgi:hypothetical protein